MSDLFYTLTRLPPPKTVAIAADFAIDGRAVENRLNPLTRKQDVIVERSARLGGVIRFSDALASLSADRLREIAESLLAEQLMAEAETVKRRAEPGREGG